MNEYYLMQGNQRIGPATVNELARLQFEGDVLAWTSGMQSWTPAYQIPELASLLRTRPPPVPTTSGEHSFVPPARSIMLGLIIFYGLVLSPFLFLLHTLYEIRTCEPTNDGTVGLLLYVSVTFVTTTMIFIGALGMWNGNRNGRTLTIVGLLTDTICGVLVLILAALAETAVSEPTLVPGPFDIVMVFTTFVTWCFEVICVVWLFSNGRRACRG